ncbi:ubiquitinyl hydrolase 1 [Dictyocaulus viviparus]|uniref:ubiquitinyl hydrolase 1 n=1 Tax=Dictyocaulus viviparus TaxID=29172 RepID=A0A0D8XLR1_DICVI|nr:ubiquitinyl hydrolase 1 [Dictyocaulus viviparus]
MSQKAQPSLFASVKSPPDYGAKSTTPLATGGGPTVEEQCTIEHIRSFLGSSDFDEDLCLKAVRHPRLRSQKTSNEEEYLQEVVGVYMDEMNNVTRKEHQRSQTPRPVQGCPTPQIRTIAELTAETSHRSAGQTVPVSSSGPTTYTTTPMILDHPSAVEERELAIAESLISQGPSGSRSYASSLPSNPEELLRKEGVSVGLHNTGNTCWFNVVAQLLFHLPRFRRIVYEQVPRYSQLEYKGTAQKTELMEMDLVQQMCYLFACMDVGNKRYVDPSEALKVVSALAARNKSDVIVGRQQDASEMMSNLMEWMEKGLSSFSSLPEKIEDLHAKELSVESNHSLKSTEISPPVSIEEGCDGMDTTNSQPFSDIAHFWNKLEYTSLFPVQVSHGNLHDALEAHQFLNDSGKEPWFESLPAVLIFSLGRYFFNGSKGETEKLNMRFHFPRTIFMDRYMARNYECVTIIRDKRNLLRKELANVRAELKGFNEFPIGDHTDKVTNVLKAALHFVKGHLDQSEVMDDDSKTAPLSSSATTGKLHSFVEDKPPVIPISSHFQHFSEFVGDLENSIIELEEKHNKLCVHEAELIKMIDEIYDIDGLKQHKYQLHAVAIHQGHANAGHYWAYVRKGNDDSQWEKFNDQRVDCATWSDIETEAIGGTRTTSAYFLLYVSSAAEPWLFSSDSVVSSFLKNDIRRQVEDENAHLDSEVERYRCTQNEDGKGNVDSHEAPCDSRLSVPPPPIRFCRRLFMTFFKAVSDPANLGISLKMYCDPLFDESALEVEYKKLFSLLEFNKMTYPPTVNRDTVIENQAKLMCRSVLKPMFVALVRRSEAAGNLAKSSEIYNKLISHFYDDFDNLSCSMQSPPLRCLPDFCYAMGFRVPAKMIRFAILRALIHADSEEIVKHARAELEDFNSAPFADHYVVLFQHASHLFDLVKILWNVVRQVATDMNHNNTSNVLRLSWKTIEINFKILKMVSAVTNIYERLYVELGNIQGTEYQAHSDFIIPSFIIRGINIIPILGVFATIVEYLVDRTNPREEIARLLTESLTWVELIVHRLATWARNGCKDAEKVISHINETLNMIALVFQSSAAPIKREISRRIHGATQLDRHFESPVQAFISQATDLCHEIEQANYQLSLLGLTDHAEADNVYTRMMAVVSDIINNAMLADERTSFSVDF